MEETTNKKQYITTEEVARYNRTEEKRRLHNLRVKRMGVVAFRKPSFIEVALSHLFPFLLFGVRGYKKQW